MKELSIVMKRRMKKRIIHGAVSAYLAYVSIWEAMISVIIQIIR
jgi:hypothetical protein